MGSKIDTCNAALSVIGSDTIVSSIDPPDGSVEAGHCARFYPISLLELLDSFPWSFAKKRVQLAAVENPSNVWRYAYALPADCLSPKRVLQAYTFPDFDSLIDYGGPITYDESALFTERGGAEFSIESGVLLTNEPEATLLYIYEQADPNRYSPAFVTAHIYLLASYLTGPLIKGDAGASASSRFRQVVFGADGMSGLSGRARMLDGNKSAERTDFTPSSIRVRS